MTTSAILVFETSPFNRSGTSPGLGTIIAAAPPVGEQCRYRTVRMRRRFGRGCKPSELTVFRTPRHAGDFAARISRSSRHICHPDHTYAPAAIVRGNPNAHPLLHPSQRLATTYIPTPRN
jgi:hypothetical protein